MSPATLYKFYGCDPQEGDDLVRQQQFQKNAAAFWQQGEDIPQRGPAPQSMGQASDVFWGVEEKPKGMKLGAPIPGTSSFVPRIQADNVFATTYHASNEHAGQSMNRINAEKAETLKQTQQFMPYNAARKAAYPGQ